MSSYPYVEQIIQAMKTGRLTFYNRFYYDDGRFYEMVREAGQEPREIRELEIREDIIAGIEAHKNK